MNKVKEVLKRIWDYVWECFKGSFMSGFTYVLASMILLMLTVKDGAKYSEQMTWCVVVIVLALAYNGLLTWNYGATNFEMLVSGNMKRMSMEKFGTEYKISSHKYVKEYRIWKGFAMGAFCVIIPLIAALFFGANAEEINLVALGEGKMDEGKGIAVLIGLFFSGWTILPFYCMNMAGITVSYYLSLLIAVLPVFVSGGTYIWGAYAKRAKNIRAQELADRAAQAEANKPKKINYCGLPGTKPKKRK